MALPKTIAQPSDVPELVREHYTQQDGVWTLTLLYPEDHAGQATALVAERKLRREADTALSTLKAKYDGIDPDEVTALKEKLKSFDDKMVYDQHGIEELVARRTHEMKTTSERQLQAKERELTTWKTQAETADRKWRRDRIETGLTQAAIKAGVSKEGLPDAVSRGLALFNDVDEKGNAVAKEGDEVKYGKDGVSPFTPDEFFINLKPDARHLWPSSSGGGAGGHQNGNGNAGVDYNKIASPTERLTAYRQAQGTGR